MKTAVLAVLVFLAGCATVKPVMTEGMTYCEDHPIGDVMYKICATDMTVPEGCVIADGQNTKTTLTLIYLCKK